MVTQRTTPKRVTPKKEANTPGQGRIDSFFTRKAAAAASPSQASPSAAAARRTPTSSSKSSPIKSKPAVTHTRHQDELSSESESGSESDNGLFRGRGSRRRVDSDEDFQPEKHAEAELDDDDDDAKTIDSDSDASAAVNSTTISEGRSSTPSTSMPETPADDDPATTGYFFGSDPFVPVAGSKPQLPKSTSQRSLRSAGPPADPPKKLFSLFDSPSAKGKRAHEADEDDDAFLDDDDDDDVKPRKRGGASGTKPKGGVSMPSVSSGKGWKSKFAQQRPFRKMPFVPSLSEIAEMRAKVKEKADSISYPPIHDLADIFGDMIDRAPAILELAKTLKDRPLRVATMCSGTESPLLALELMCRAIHQKHGIRIKIQHVFSCEIEPFKQAYIERNFSPPILFRDVTELGGKKAHTAYGALVDVPGDVDILIAGTSCVDYSHLNNSKKGLNDGGESGRTFRGMLEWVMRHKPTLVILENVKNAPWVGVAETIVSEAGYDVGFSNTFDTKNYYIPHTRQRGYLLACRNNKNSLPQNWELITNMLMRPASSPLDAFLLPTDDPRIQRVRRQFAHGEGLSKGRSTIDWSKCQSRHERARDEEELGKTRPLTAWEEGGTCKMSHDGWNEWAVRQPERVTDLLDITTLRFAAMGQDPIYKSKIWELSQNVDRNVAASRPGIAPCLTPSGIPFLTSRGGPLIGLEALSLQGLPLDELLLTRETDDQLQDLAGNAMSSTVVGACVLAALIVGMDDLREDGEKRKAAQVSSKDKKQGELKSTSDVVEKVVEDGQDAITRSNLLAAQPLDLTSSQKVSMPDLLKAATNSAQLCSCEGRSRLVDVAVHRCVDCDHTACETCKGRPVHKFVPDELVRSSPDNFAPLLKAALPMRLESRGLTREIISSMMKGLPFASDSLANRWGKRVAEVLESAEFRFQTLLRQKVWQVQFAAPGARLDLLLDPVEPHWRILVEPPIDEPAGSPLRKLLIQPVARMALDATAKRVDLLHGQWELCLPTTKVTIVTVRSTGPQVQAWQSAMGLGGKWADKLRYSQMHVSVPEDVRDLLDADIDGAYDLLEQCGTACGALHVRRKDQDTANHRRLFLFIDTDRFQDQSADRFVFSTDTSRWPYPLERVSVAQLEPGWRPAFAVPSKEEVEQQVKMTISGAWRKVERFNVRAGTGVDGKMAIPKQHFDLDLRQEDCSSSVAVLTCEAPVLGRGMDRIWPADGVWGQVDLLHKTNTTFSHLAWLVERLPDVEALDGWMPAKHDPFDCATANCARCAPSEPDIQWLAIPGKPVVPVENTMQAGPYEQALKNRPSPFVVQLRLKKDVAQVRFGLNAATLMHRAVSRLPPSKNAGAVELSWRLTKLDRSIDMFKLPRYTLRSNRLDPEAATPELFALQLRREQKRSLTWMLEQEEADVQPFSEEEISEGLLDPLGWRAEGRAVRPVTVRGGVLADAVGYGKTCISLALIASSPHRRDLPAAPAGEEGNYVSTRATLIIVPGHLCKQWEKVVRKFCGNKLTVRVVTSKAELNKLTVRTVLNCDILIMSVTVYKSDAYWETLASIAASNPLPNRAGRFFNAALKKSLEALKNRVRELTGIDRDGGVRQLLKSIRSKVDFDDSHLTTHKARSRLKGKAYMAANGKDEDDESDDEKVLAAAAKKGTSKALPKELQSTNSKDPDPWGLGSASVQRDWHNMSCPPLEMFMWNRVIVDEFHYIGETMDRTLAGVTSLQARSKWILSGTPPTADFADVKSIAVFLNVHLGVDDDADTTKDSVRKAREKMRTAAEKFNNLREMHSPAWHHRRQEVAQRFLDRFVRSNEPEIGELPSQQLIKPIRLPAAESALYLELAHAIENLDLRHQRKVFKARPKAKAIKAKAAKEFIDDSSDDSDSGKKKSKKASAAKDVKRKQGDPQLEMSHRDQRLIDTLGSSASPEEALLKRASVYDDFAGVDLDAMEGVNNAIKACEYIVRERRKQLADCREQLERELPIALEQHLLVLHHFGYRDENRQAFADYVRNAHNAAWGDLESKAMIREILDDANCTMSSVTRAAAKTHFSRSGVLQSALKRRAKECAAAEKGGGGGDEDGMKGKVDQKAAAWAEEYHLRALVHQLTRLRNELVGRVNALRFFTMIRDCQRAHLEGVHVNITCPASKCKHGGNPVPLSEVSISSTCGHTGCKDCVLREAYIGKCPTDGCAALAKPTSIVHASSLGAEDDGKATRYGTKLALLCALLRRIPSTERALVFCQFDTLTATVAEALSAYGISFVQLTGTAKRRSDLLEAYQEESGARVLLLNVEDESAAGSNLTVANHVIFVGPLLKQEQQQYEATMTQAIGRCVRYGQLKKVCVWRLLSLETIDQEVLERRERVRVVREEEEERGEGVLVVEEMEREFVEALGGPLVLQDVGAGKGKRKREEEESSPKRARRQSQPKSKRKRAASSEEEDDDDDIEILEEASTPARGRRAKAKAKAILISDDEEDEEDE
ncbi:C-5 cytosine methyltransferase [Kalmanozyma brasiliensis GHG001]|uniref:Helicase ATP-binding domain-containing protein n=1 Tax=Kalmanozyma brasiliensis (strain GHG001) TaxID=1365824 RepID=V5GT63_KALBG|nr:C-5 cytosine methyltransferase [Kalmanozyma brasiliensis GHG001]EST09082.1 C-5 cytosine methyltransferase [Kalmanozyma brasiliensis GHG001]